MLFVVYLTNGDVMAMGEDAHGKPSPLGKATSKHPVSWLSFLRKSSNKWLLKLICMNDII